MKPRFFSAPLPLSDGSLVQRMRVDVDGAHHLVWTAVNAEQAKKLVKELNRAVTEVLGPG